MLSIDVSGLVTAYTGATTHFSEQSTSGLESLIRAMADDPELTDVRWAVYMLATVKHECANRWQPIEEVGQGKNKPYGAAVRVQDADGTVYTNTYFGRGYVQLTWKLNYDRVGRALGLGNALVLHPEHALEATMAYRILSYGMREGFFTGKKLADYIHDNVCDYVNARRIINGVDCAELIAGYARQFEILLEKSVKVATAASA